MLPQEYQTMRSVEDSYWWYRTLRSHVVRELAKRLLPGAHVLDAGCGTGGMLDALRDHPARWQLSGCDLSPDAVALTCARGFTDISQSSLSAIPMKSEECDAVVCLDVLYHESVDESAAMHQLHRVLRPGGWLVLNLPAWDSLAGEHDRAVKGARRYTPDRIRALLPASRWHIESLHGWNALLLPAVWISRQLSRLRHSATPHPARSDLKPLPHHLNRMLAAIASADFTLCRSLQIPLGTSLFAIARKPCPLRS
jgi:SAM-dependent methyltransferase